jgi:general secretion pathway protein D
VPYITNSQISNTGQTINSVAYTNVGVILDVIPHINPDGQVTLDIAPQVSALDPSSGVPISSNVIAPVFTVRQAQSRVTIRNGETIVIGGLMQDQKVQVINKVPLLGDIPYLGMLFKETTNAKVKTELLIFLTPHVAMSPDQLKGMTADEQRGLKLVPSAVQPGLWEQEMVGMERGATTTRPTSEIRIQNGNLTPQPAPLLP